MASKKTTAKNDGTVGEATVAKKSTKSKKSAETAEESGIATLGAEDTPQFLSSTNPYERKTWVDGEIIYDDDLNHMEEGIENNSNDLADIVVAEAASHNTVVRKKSLGSSVSSAQHTAISGGTFDDIFLGDYWTISSVTYDIAGLNYLIRTGNSASLTTNHVVCVPRARLYTAPMNATNTTEGAYVGSAMYTGESIEVSGTTYTGLTNAISTIESAFGSRLLEHEAYLNNATTDGYPSAGEWVTGRKVDLMTENMVYGAPVMEQMSFGGTRIYNYRTEKSALPLFLFDPYLINIRATYWLRDVVSSTYFAYVHSYGNAYGTNASGVYGVRPYFLVS